MYTLKNNIYIYKIYIIIYIYKTKSLHFTPETNTTLPINSNLKKIVLKIKPTDIWLSKDICNHTELELYREKLMI